MRCLAITRRGRRCSRRAVFAGSCRQHQYGHDAWVEEVVGVIAPGYVMVAT